jgi:hypothetical protein
VERTSLPLETLLLKGRWQENKEAPTIRINGMRGTFNWRHWQRAKATNQKEGKVVDIQKVNWRGGTIKSVAWEDKPLKSTFSRNFSWNIIWRKKFDGLCKTKKIITKKNLPSISYAEEMVV